MPIREAECALRSLTLTKGPARFKLGTGNAPRSGSAAAVGWTHMRQSASLGLGDVAHHDLLPQDKAALACRQMRVCAQDGEHGNAQSAVKVIAVNCSVIDSC